MLYTYTSIVTLIYPYLDISYYMCHFNLSLYRYAHYICHFNPLTVYNPYVQNVLIKMFYKHYISTHTQQVHITIIKYQCAIIMHTCTYLIINIIKYMPLHFRNDFFEIINNIPCTCCYNNNNIYVEYTIHVYNI